MQVFFFVSTIGSTSKLNVVTKVQRDKALKRLKHHIVTETDLL